MPYFEEHSDDDMFWNMDGAFERQTYLTDGALLICKGCNEPLCSFTPFCGYCGLKNLQFDDILFCKTFGYTAEEAQREMCTDHWHRVMLSAWTDRSETAQKVRERLTQSGIKVHNLHYCARCGIEMINNPGERAREVQHLIDSLTKT